MLLCALPCSQGSGHGSPSEVVADMHSMLCLAKWSLALAQDAHILYGVGWVYWLPPESLGNVLEENVADGAGVGWIDIRMAVLSYHIPFVGG